MSTSLTSQPDAPAHGPKDPAKVRAGRAGARRRWGSHPSRVVRLDELTASQRRLVLALVEAVKNEAGAGSDTAAPANAEVRDGTPDSAE